MTMLDRTIAPEVHTMSRLKLPTPHTVVLDNGVTLHYVDGGSQDVNQLVVMWQGGFNDIANPVAARLAAALMCEGTARMSGAEISECVDFHGGLLKASAGPHFMFLSLSALNSMTEGLLPVVEDVINHATFPEDKFTVFREIEAHNFELSQSNVTTLARDAVSKLIKGEHHPEAIVQDTEMIMATTIDEVREHYARFITGSHCHAYLSGRISDDVLRRTIALLEKLPADKTAVPMIVVPFAPQKPQRVDLVKPGAVQAAVMADLPAPDRSDPDYVPLRFAVTALGGYFGSRLMKNIREDKGYTYGIGAYLFGSREGSEISIMAQADQKYVEPLIDEVRKEIVGLATNPLGKEELMALKQFLSSSLMEYLDSPFAIMDYYRTIETVGIPERYFDRQVDMIRGLDADLICEMARKYIDPQQLRIAVCK